MKKRFFVIVLISVSISFNIFAQSESNKDINFNKPFHSFGISGFLGTNFAPKLEMYSGSTINPELYHSLVPEIILQYNYMIKNGFGVAIEVPFGMFRRMSLVRLSGYGASNDVLLETGDFYVGLTLKAFVFKELSKNVCMQGELGIKFNPFLHSADKWYTTDYNSVVLNPNFEPYYYEDNSSINFLTVDQKYYAVPDATAGIMFFFHSQKNPRHNLMLGITANLSFVERIKVTYNTYFSELELNENSEHGYGKYSWNSSAIGITLGYRFFRGK
ncbi:hypothetical protein LJC30_03855 [Odoribacter sp. OttesenSCG-928-L07]|nr:hypothetical protein [Odoribacter sp. OttesenSCG-928-L07]MDL2239480.1 hypothetical protein [Bacteroidales bacterium OttesenSCG-928-L14]MDL2240699.1 hypothetical protein [Bacteroidales bacterium OttesenSCG-928-K22]